MNQIFAAPVRRVAMLSMHTCPLALLGGKKTGGMNVYVRDFGREFFLKAACNDICASDLILLSKLWIRLPYGQAITTTTAGREFRCRS